MGSMLNYYPLDINLRDDKCYCGGENKASLHHRRLRVVRRAGGAGLMPKLRYTGGIGGKIKLRRGRPPFHTWNDPDH
jgi:hypothetical protein